LAALVQKAAAQNPLVEWLGRRPLGEVLNIAGDAAFLVMPSVWYETFGRTIIEAFARGTPVIASRLGAMAELVDAGQTGFLFRAGDAADLAAAVEKLMADPAERARMRPLARAAFERSYTADQNYLQLINIYEKALENARRRRNEPAEKSQSAARWRLPLQTLAVPPAQNVGQ
jgi:glycosyltransferase involved in cell wall biosynthesis